MLVGLEVGVTVGVGDGTGTGSAGVGTAVGIGAGAAVGIEVRAAVDVGVVDGPFPAAVAPAAGKEAAGDLNCAAIAGCPAPNGPGMGSFGRYPLTEAGASAATGSSDSDRGAVVAPEVGMNC